MTKAEGSCCTLKQSIDFNLASVSDIISARTNSVVFSIEPFRELSFHLQISDAVNVTSVGKALFNVYRISEWIIDMGM